MAGRDKGPYALLGRPSVYKAVQNIMNPGKIRRLFIEEFVQAQPGQHILDIGCGTASLLHHLPEVDYTGFDPNAAYIAAARAAHGDRGTFHVGVFNEAAAAAIEPVDIATIVAVLHHLTDEEAYDLLRTVRSVLKPGGRLVTLDNVFVEHQNPIARFLIAMDRGQNIRTPDGYAALARRSFSEVRGAVVHKTLPPYTYWMMTAA